MAEPVSGVTVALIGVVMAIGLFGTVMPVMPGLLIMWGGALAFALVTGWGAVGVVCFLVITALLVGGTILSYVLPHRSGVQAGAAKSSLRLGIAGAIVGFFVIPVLGMAIGGVLGVYAGEYRRLGNGPAAWTTTRSVMIGFLKGALVEVGTGVAILAVWITWVVLLPEPLR